MPLSVGGGRKAQTAAEFIPLLAISAALVLILVAYALYTNVASADASRALESRAYWSGVASPLKITDWSLITANTTAGGGGVEANLSVVVRNPTAAALVLRDIRITPGQFATVLYYNGTYAGPSDALAIKLQPGEQIALKLIHFQTGAGAYIPTNPHDLDVRIEYDSDIVSSSQTGTLGLIGPNVYVDMGSPPACPSGQSSCGATSCCPSDRCCDGTCVLEADPCEGVICPAGQACNPSCGTCGCTPTSCGPDQFCNATSGDCQDRTAVACAVPANPFNTTLNYCGPNNCDPGLNLTCDTGNCTCVACSTSVGAFCNETVPCCDFNQLLCDLSSNTCYYGPRNISCEEVRDPSFNPIQDTCTPNNCDPALNHTCDTGSCTCVDCVGFNQTCNITTPCCDFMGLACNATSGNGVCLYEHSCSLGTTPGANETCKDDCSAGYFCNSSCQCEVSSCQPPDTWCNRIGWPAENRTDCCAPGEMCMNGTGLCCDLSANNFVCNYLNNSLSACCQVGQACNSTVGCCEPRAGAFCNITAGLDCCGGMTCNMTTNTCNFTTCDNGECCPAADNLTLCNFTNDQLNGFFQTCCDLSNNETCNNVTGCCGNNNSYCNVSAGQLCCEGFTCASNNQCIPTFDLFCPSPPNSFCYNSYYMGFMCCNYTESKKYYSDGCLCCPNSSYEICGTGGNAVCCPGGQCVNGVCCENATACTTGAFSQMCCDAPYTCLNNSFTGYQSCCDNLTVGICKDDGLCCNTTCTTSSNNLSKCCAMSDPGSNYLCKDGTCCDTACLTWDRAGSEKCCDDSPDPFNQEVCGNGACCSAGGCAGNGTNAYPPNQISQCCAQSGDTFLCNGACCSDEAHCQINTFNAPSSLAVKCCEEPTPNLCYTGNDCCQEECTEVNGGQYCCDAYSACTPDTITNGDNECCCSEDAVEDVNGGGKSFCCAKTSPGKPSVCDVGGPNTPGCCANCLDNPKTDRVSCCPAGADEICGNGECCGAGGTGCFEKGGNDKCCPSGTTDICTDGSCCGAGGSACAKIGTTNQTTCCPAGKPAVCEDGSCCSSSSSCLKLPGGSKTTCCDGGSSCNGECCPAGRQCLNTGNASTTVCCPAGTVVAGGTCCPTVQACGEVCCGGNSACSGGHCCPLGQVWSGGGCCPAATPQRCGDGTCCASGGCTPGPGGTTVCCPSGVMCGSTCCASGEACTGSGSCCASGKLYYPGDLALSACCGGTPYDSNGNGVSDACCPTGSTAYDSNSDGKMDACCMFGTQTWAPPCGCCAAPAAFCCPQNDGDGDTLRNPGDPTPTTSVCCERGNACRDLDGDGKFYCDDPCGEVGGTITP